MARKKSEKHTTHPPAINKAEDKQIDLIDQLAEFEEFQQLLPVLRQQLATGKTSKEILSEMAPYAAARVSAIALTEKDPAKALAAAKDVLDRVYGKATERREVKHKFEDLPEEELDALLESKLRDVSDADYEED